MALAVPGLSLILSPGWYPGEPFIAQGDIETVAAGDGINGAAQHSCVSKVIAPGSRAYVRYISVRVVDMAAYDQLYFSLKLNGALLLPWRKISGEQFVDDHLVEVEQEIEAGKLEIGAANISGTSEAGAAAAVDIRVLARFVGFLLNQAG